MSAPIKLYCQYYQDRSDRVRWLCEELNLPYENIWLKKAQGELDTKDYRSVNPMGRLPTIVDGDTVIHESIAICLYLVDKYGEGKLAPHRDDLRARADYYQWMVHSVGTLEAFVARMFLDFEDDKEENYNVAFVKKQCAIVLPAYEQILSKQDYFLSSGFSAVDIVMSSIIPGAHDFLVKGHPVMERYMERLMKRPAAISARVFTG